MPQQAQAAQTAAEWVMVARSVAQLPNSQPQALHLMEYAELWAHNGNDWLELAAAWQQDFQNRSNSLRCLEESEVRAENAQQWIRIAQFWAEEFQNSAKGIQALEKAEGLARNAADWGSIGFTWEKPFADAEKSKRCLRVAYGEVRSASISDSPYDAMGDALADRQAIERGGVTGLGFIEKDPKSFLGHWDSKIVSERHPGCLSRYYNFSLSEPALIRIVVKSNYGDARLYLMSGDNTDGPVIDEGLSIHACGINRGTYTVEVVVGEEAADRAFTLTMSHVRIRP